MATKQFISNNFMYGEVGQRLLAQRSSDIYKSSAKEINNMLITDSGTLKVAKKLKSEALNVNGSIIDTLETSREYYLLLTTTTLYLIKKEDNSIIKSITHSLSISVRMNIISRYKLILYDGIHKIKLYDLNNNDIAIKSDVKIFNPMKDKKDLQLDIYQMVKDPQDASKVVPFKRSTTKGDDLLLKLKDNKIYAINSTQQINRIYTSYIPLPTRDSFTNPKLGEMYGMLKIAYKVEDNKQYVLENENITLGSLTTDAKYRGDYFTTMIGANTDGVFSYGNLIDVSIPEKVGFHQDRLIFYKDGYLYFSELGGYLNFRNDEDTKDSFYLQLNPIDNRRGDLLGLISSTGLYVITDVGIYLIGYGSFQLTPKTSSGAVHVLTNMDVSDEFMMVGNHLYFLNKNNILKSLSLNTESQQLSFGLDTIDQYSANPIYKHLTSMTIEDRKYLIATKEGEDKIFLFEPTPASTGLFRRITLDFIGDTTNVLTLDDRLITQSNVLSYSDSNYDKASIFLNPPSLKGNSILCDGSSSVTSVATKLINEDRDAILGVKINSFNIQNLGTNVDDKFNIYKIQSKFNIENGFGIDIYTKENDKTIELQSIQTEINVVENF